MNNQLVFTWICTVSVLVVGFIIRSIWNMQKNAGHGKHFVEWNDYGVFCNDEDD